MTSRRPMTHLYSGNGRYSNQNGDDVLSPRLDGRNYLSSVRPENRSTFCTVMSQLTEETQPCFETTIKSKAVSLTCNVKFSCVVTGYPVPELTWYKDDMELDRYCGLPKYEIFQNGKIHMLHIYNCTVDDAAIYQVSARNSKGIVSCSGVLEVGTMGEYKIHQRFFAKLKQKAELKRRELEHSNCQEKETIHQEHVRSKQNNVRWIDGLLHNTSSVQVGEDTEAKEGEVTAEQPESRNEKLNNISVKVYRYPMISDKIKENDSQHMSSHITSIRQQVIYSTEKADVCSTTLSTKVKESRNNITVYNGFAETFTTQSSQGLEEEKDAHEGMSLAKILVESLQFRLCEENQKTTLQSQQNTGDKGNNTQERKKIDNEWENMKAEDRHQVWESCWKEEQERSFEKEQEDFRQLEPEHRYAAASESKIPVYKEPEYQHKSALSSVFHSLKDIFFGKSKKTPDNTDSSRKDYNLNGEKEILAVNTEEYCHLSQQQQYDTSDVSGTVTDQPVPVAGDHLNQIENFNADTHFFQETPSLHIKTEMENVHLNTHIHGFTTNTIKDIPQASNIHHDSVEEEKEAGPEALQKKILLTIHEASDDHTEPTEQGCIAPIEQRMQDCRELQAVKQQNDSDITLMSTSSMLQPNRTSQVDQETLVVAKSSVHKNSIRVDERIQNNMDDAIAGSTKSINKSQPNTAEVTDQCIISLYEKENNSTFQDKSSPVLKISHENSYIMDNNITESRNSTFSTCIENMQGFAATTVKHDTDKLETICSTGHKDNNIESNEDDSIKKKQDQNEKKMIGNKTKQRVDSNEEITDIISEQNGGISESKKQKPEMAGLDTQLRVEKTKINTKVQPEGEKVMSMDQAVVSPIIILPDTRETVIKNVTKMRASPFVPEIKSIAQDKLKQEDNFSVLKIDVLAEHERVGHPVVHEIENPRGTVLGTSNKNDMVEVISGSVDATPHQQEKNDRFPSDQRNIEVNTKKIEAQMGDSEEPFRVSNDWSRGYDSNSIPIISVAVADDITPFQEQGKEHEISVFQDTVHQNNVALNIQANSSSLTPTTHVESTTGKSIKNDIVPESLTIMLREVVGHFDSDSSLNTNQVFEKAALKKVEAERRNMDTQLSSDVSSALSSKSFKNTTAFDIDVCPDKESVVELDVDRFQRDKPTMEKLGLTTPVGPTLPPLSPASLRKLMAKNNPHLESQGSTVPLLGDRSEKKGENSGGSTPTSTLSCENSPKMKRRDSLTLIPSATPEELASGARRKIYLAKMKSEDEGLDSQGKSDSQYMSPSQVRRTAFLQHQGGQQPQHMEKRSPLLGRCKTPMEVQKPKEEPSEETSMSRAEQTQSTESKTAEKEKSDPYKAPQVIRKIRGEPFSDALGHLKLWCQFFNILSDSTIRWFKDDLEIAEIKRCAGDESQVALAIVQVSSKDCGVYGCTIKNDYGTDTTDYLLSPDILAEFFLRDDSEVWEEIEMTPLLFNKGLVDPSYWGKKFFGRIMTEELQIEDGYAHKITRAKAIYGLDPIFDSGSTCIVKVRNQIAYGTKEENGLAEINLEIAKQECKIHNTVLEYCKIFAAEARVIEKFGFALEVIPLYLIYRPANTIPYATMEADLKGEYSTYCTVDKTGRLITQATSEVEQKCCTFQHWLYQWTNGNLLVTHVEGVDAKISNVKIVTKSKGYQNLTDKGSPKILEQFVITHQCNYYCQLLGLRVLTTIDSLQQSKLKTSRSPMLTRKVTDSSSPQLLKKCSSSPQLARNVNSSPKMVKKAEKDGENNPTMKNNTMEVTKAIERR